MRRVWIAGALVALVALALRADARASAQESARGWRRARVSLAGPLDEAVLREPGGSRTTIATSLGPGAHRTLDVPLSGTPVELARRASVETRPAAGRCELEVPEAADWDAPWLDLPAGLRARTRPVVERRARVPTLVEASLLGAVLLAVLGARRRPIAALGLGLAGAGVLLVLPAPNPGAPPAAAALEGDAASGRWLLVVARAEELDLPLPGPLRLEIEPDATPLELQVELRSSGPEQWLARANEARLIRVDELPSPGAPLAPEENRLADFSRCWVRSSDASWVDHGAWSRGEALPAPEGAGSPPGWLASGLPQGVRVLIGRVDAVDESGPWRLPADALAGPLWLRYVGF